MSVTLLGTSFPESLAGLDRGVTEIPRSEWTLWRGLYENRSKLPLLPGYGDYGVAPVPPPEVNPRVMRMSVNLRYTTETSWLIARGRYVKEGGKNEFFGLCRLIRGQGRVSGSRVQLGRSRDHVRCAWLRRCGERHFLAQDRDLTSPGTSHIPARQP